MQKYALPTLLMAAHRLAPVASVSESPDADRLAVMPARSLISPLPALPAPQRCWPQASPTRNPKKTQHTEHSI